MQAEETFHGVYHCPGPALGEGLLELAGLRVVVRAVKIEVERVVAGVKT